VTLDLALAESDDRDESDLAIYPNAWWKS